MNYRSICFIILSLGPGGAERYTSELANYLINNGYDVNIILLSKSNIFYNLNEDIKVFQPKKNLIKNTFFKKTIKLFQIANYLRDTLIKLQPSMVFNFAFPSLILLATIGINLNFYLFLRSNPSKTYMIERYNIPLSIRKLLYRRAKALIAQTDGAYKILSRQFPKTKIFKIPNIINNESIEYNFKGKKESIIITAGRLIRSKQIDHAIMAFSKLNAPSWKLFIIGEGPEKNYLKSLVKKFDIESSVYFIGNVKNIQSYFKKSEIFIFSSAHEGFPNVLLEAMATPLACVSYNCEFGPSELIINEKNGYLIENGNIKELKEKLQTLVDSSYIRKKFSNNASNLRGLYNASEIGEKVENLLIKNKYE